MPKTQKNINLSSKAVNSKLSKFRKSVFAEADKKVAEILGELESIKQSELDAAKDDALNKHFNAMQQKISDIKHDCIKKVATHELETKKNLLLARENICDKVFDNIAKRLLEFSKKEEYINYIKSCFSKSLQNSDVSSGEIFIKQDDKPLWKLILEEASGEFSLITNDDIRLGGFVLINSDLGIAIDCTLDNALAEQKVLFKKQSKLSIEN